MKKLTVITLLCMFSAGNAVAQDWAGLYVGINQASQDLTADWTTTEVRDPDGLVIDPDSETAASLSSDESAAGLRIGYNWTFDQWVVGVEAVSGAIEHATSIADRIPGLEISSNNSYVNFSAESGEVNLRLRGGYLVTPQLLVFLTAGNTELDVSVTGICPDNDGDVCNPFIDETQTHTSSTSLSETVIGLGAEYAINRFLIHLEMFKADFGAFDFTVLPDHIDSFGADATVGMESKTLQLGVSYDF